MEARISITRYSWIRTFLSCKSRVADPLPRPPVMTPDLESCIGLADTFLADHESRVWDTDHVPHVPSQDWCLIVCISCIPMKSLAILPSHCNPKIPIWLHKSQSITSNEQLNFQNIHSTLMTTQHSHNCINYAFTICSWQYRVSHIGYRTQGTRHLVYTVSQSLQTMVLTQWSLHTFLVHTEQVCVVFLSFPESQMQHRRLRLGLGGSTCSPCPVTHLIVFWRECDMPDGLFFLCWMWGSMSPSATLMRNSLLLKK